MLQQLNTFVIPHDLTFPLSSYSLYNFLASLFLEVNHQPPLFYIMFWHTFSSSDVMRRGPTAYLVYVRFIAFITALTDTFTRLFIFSTFNSRLNLFSTFSSFSLHSFHTSILFSKSLKFPSLPQLHGI